MEYIVSKNIISLKDEYPGYTKYFDAGRYVRGRIKLCKTLELDKESNLDILDISTGFGYFPVVCRFMGHNVKATDIENNLYDNVTSQFEIDKRYMSIDDSGDIDLPFEDMFDVISGFAVVPMSFLTNDGWFLFLQKCFNQIREGGYMFLSPNQGGINGLNEFLNTDLGKSIYATQHINTIRNTIVRRK